MSFSLDVKKEIIKLNNKEQDIKSIARKAFLDSGSINNPNNRYHLEIKMKDEKMAEDIKTKLQENDINIKRIKNILYIKEGEEISKFLAFIGASNSVLKFEEIRVQKDMNNKINRLVNCETANLNKIINASVEQVEAIKKLKNNGKFDKLDESLKEIAELRLKHTDASFEELGKMLKQPIGKSGVNYRLKKIIKISKE